MGAAVNTAAVAAQTGMLAAETATAGDKLPEDTVTAKGAETTVLCVAHPALEVTEQVMASALARLAVV